MPIRTSSPRPPTPAERLDEAVDRLLSDQRPAVDSELLPLVDTATRLREALPLLPTGHNFEVKLAARLAHPGGLAAAAAAVATLGEVTRRELQHPTRLMVTGAASAAVGVSLTALVVWRNTHRHAGSR